MVHQQSNESLLSDRDKKIVEAIETDTRYKLWGWEVPDYCTLNLIFDDSQSSCRMGLTLNWYPVDKEEETT